MPYQLQIALAVLTLSAAAFDLRTRRIPNWLALSGLILGFGGNILLFGAEGALIACEGLALALAIYIPLYALRAMGAGDAKLMAAIGTLAGPRHWLTIFLITALAGGVISLIVIARKRRLAHTLHNVSVLSSELLHLRAPALSNSELNVKSPSALRLPHAIPIAVGSLIFLALSLQPA